MGGNLADIACVGSLEDVGPDRLIMERGTFGCGRLGGRHAQRSSACFLALSRYFMLASTSSSDATDTVVLPRF
jgi:hypothetical protein